MNNVNFTSITVLFFLEDLDIEKILVSSKISSGEKSYKYFTGYLYHYYKIKPLHVMIPKTSAYVKSYNGQTKWIYFLIEDVNLIEKCNTIWDKVSAGIKKEFDSKPVYNKKFLKTKIKSYGDEATDFHSKEFPKVDSNHTCFLVISLDSPLNKYGNYYPQVFLKESKYNQKEKKCD